MDALKEFLESSTIHGLAHISNAPSKMSRGFWLFVVLLGFSAAFYLINSSYVDWQASPIATSISTHPLSELNFPNVTICPPTPGIQFPSTNFNPNAVHLASGHGPGVSIFSKNRFFSKTLSSGFEFFIGM